MHFNASLPNHFADLIGKFVDLKNKVDKDIVPVNLMQQASGPDLARKILTLDEQVRFTHFYTMAIRDRNYNSLLFISLCNILIYLIVIISFLL